MPTLRSGYIIGGAYADKIRRTLFAQTRDMVKSGELSAQEVARAAGELNRILYEILVDRVKIEKGDVVRINVNYTVEEGKIKWDLETLRIQAWRRMPDEEVNKAIAEVKLIAKELVVRAIQYGTLKIAETDVGDIVYTVRLAERNVGVLLVTPLNENKAIVRGAVLEPTPLILKRLLIDVEPPLDDYKNNNIGSIMGKATHVETGEAEKAIREIKALIEIAEKPPAPPVEEEE